MPQSNHSDRPTDVIVIAGEILRTLHPSLFGALSAVYEDETLSQAEVADIVGRTPPTVSSYFQSLENGLQVPLTVKRGQRNTVTDTGEKVISLVRRMSSNLDLDLTSIDWSDETDRAAISKRLSPLHDSRSTEPFFILDSLYDRSDLDGLLGKPQPVWLDDVVSDVKGRQQERDKSTTLPQVRDKIKRFDDAGALTFDGTQITLGEQGQEQARLVTKLVQFLKERDDIDTESSENVEHKDSSESADNGGAVHSEVDDSFHRSHARGGIAQQRQGQGFLGARRTSGALSVQENPAVVLTYCLHPTSDMAPAEESHVQPPSVLQLTTLTASELADRVEQIIQEYGGDAKLVPYWALQTEMGLYPLGPAGIPPAEISEFGDES